MTKEGKPFKMTCRGIKKAKRIKVRKRKEEQMKKRVNIPKVQKEKSYNKRFVKYIWFSPT